MEQKIQEGLRAEIDKTRDSAKKISAYIAQLKKAKDVTESIEEMSKSAQDYSSVL